MRGRTVIAAGGAAALAATAVVAVGGATAAPRKPAKTVTGAVFTRSGSVKPGTKVAGGGTRVLIGAKAGWKLTSTKQAQYAAVTGDGGKTWRIASPALHIDALDAPQAVTQIGALSAKMAYAFGAGQVADVTSNGGKNWYQALFQGTVMAVVPTFLAPKTLVAYVAGFGASASPAQYVSKNGGRTWTLKTGTP
jgi:hypothetical protein